MPALIETPDEHLAMHIDGHCVAMATADLLDHLIPQRIDHSRVEDLEADTVRLSHLARDRLKPELPVGISAHGEYYAVHVLL